MRQRNTTGSPLIIPSIPAEVPPGGEIDWPKPLTGFVPVEAKPEPKTPKNSKAAAPAETEEA